MRNDDQRRRDNFAGRGFNRDDSDLYEADMDRDFQGGGYRERGQYRSESPDFQSAQHRRNQFERSTYGRMDDPAVGNSATSQYGRSEPGGDDYGRGPEYGGRQYSRGSDRTGAQQYNRRGERGFGETQSAGMTGGDERYGRGGWVDEDDRQGPGGWAGRDQRYGTHEYSGPETGYGGYDGEYGSYGRSQRSGRGTGAGQRGEQGGYERGGAFGGRERYPGSDNLRTRDFRPGGSFQSPGGSSANWDQGAYHGDDRYGGDGSGERRESSMQRYSPKGYKRSDERIREDVCEQLSHSGLDVSEVSVQVKDGHVTLEGSVKNRSVKHSIENRVDNCMGVQDIDNRIRVQRGSAMTETGGGGSSTGSGSAGQSGQSGQGASESGSKQWGASGGNQSGGSGSNKGAGT